MKRMSLLLIMLSNFSFALEYRARCNEDNINGIALMKGRNAWARKCKYIPVSVEEWNNKKRFYATFDYLNGKKAIAPKSEGAPCIKLDLDGTCKEGEGCYTPDMRLLFNGRYKKIKTAFVEGDNHVTALSKTSLLSKPYFEEVELDSYVSGKTSEEIFLVKLENGTILSVTESHPFVNSEGYMVAALELKVSDKLVSETGELLKVSSISKKLYNGVVYNILPKNNDFVKNIHVVEGVLTGSIRYQAEWSKLQHRILARKQ